MTEKAYQPSYWTASVNAYLAFVIVAVLTGVVAGVMSRNAEATAGAALLFLFFGGMLGLVVAPIVAAVWHVARKVIGETLPACLLFGLFTGCVLALLVAQENIALVGLAMGGGMGTSGGLFYWFLMRRAAFRMQKAEPDLIQEVFE